MRGSCRTTCDLEAQRPKPIYLLPRRECEAAVALPATYKPGRRNRHTCRCRQEDEVVIPAALLPGCRRRPTCCLAVDARRLLPFCDLEARRPKSSYSPPRRGCEAAVVYLPPCRGCEEVSTYLPPGGRRLSCRLAVDARRRSHCLRPG